LGPAATHRGARPPQPLWLPLSPPPHPAPAGEEFTVSDVAVGSYLLYLPLFFPDTVPLKQKHVWDYMQRLATRDACPSSYKEGMAAALKRASTSGGDGGDRGLGGLINRIAGGR
jgi:hypothetical protein